MQSQPRNALATARHNNVTCIPIAVVAVVLSANAGSDASPNTIVMNAQYEYSLFKSIHHNSPRIDQVGCTRLADGLLLPLDLNARIRPYFTCAVVDGPKSLRVLG